LSGHTEGITSLDSFGEFLLSGSHDSTVKLWNLRKKRLINSFVHDETGIDSFHPSVSTTMFCPSVTQSPTQFIYGTSSGVVKVVSVEDNTSLAVFHHSNRITALAGYGIHSDPRADPHLVFTGSSDGVLRCWDLRISSLTDSHRDLMKNSPAGAPPGPCVRAFCLPDGAKVAVNCIKALPWCAPLVSTNSSGKVCLWDLGSGRAIGYSQVFNNEKSMIHAHSQIPTLFLFSQSGQCVTWDLQKLSFLEPFSFVDNSSSSSPSPLLCSDVDFGKSRIVLGLNEKKLRLLDFS